MYDIGTYFEQSKNLSEEDIDNLIKKVEAYDKNSFSKPIVKGKKLRCFRSDWLVKYKWLHYSSKHDGGFCLPCSLFSHGAPPKLMKSHILISKPLKAANNTTTVLNSHESAKNGIHAFSSDVMNSFLNNFSGKSSKISTLTDSNRIKKVKENRALLVPLIDLSLIHI